MQGKIVRILKDLLMIRFFNHINLEKVIFTIRSIGNQAKNNITLVKTNAEIRSHEVEIIGEKLRSAMDGMKSL